MKTVTIYFSGVIEVPPDQLKMFNVLTDEVKFYSEIPEEEKDNYVLSSIKDLVDDFECEFESSWEENEIEEKIA